VLLLLPMSLKLFHTLENHEHKVCNSKINKHFHQQEIDCSFYHVQSHMASIFITTHFDLYTQLLFHESPIVVSKTETDFQIFHKSSRAPPFFIV